MDLSVYVFSGAGVKEIFQNEVGNHTWQRISPTEKRGRTHTSSITVAVLDKPQYNEVEIRPDEVNIEYTKGTGGGGQHRDKTLSCVIMTHIATGIQVNKNGRKQHKNKAEAYKEMTKRVNHFYKTGHIQDEVDERNEQIGDAGRGDKRRSYRVTDGLVNDHITGKTARLKDVLKGKIELLA